MKKLFQLLLIAAIIFLFGACTPKGLRGKEALDAYFPVEYQNLWGFINGKGQLAVNAEFPEVFPFSNGIARIKSDRYGFIDNSGKFIAEPIYGEGTGDFSEGLAAVRVLSGEDMQEGEIGYIDVKGEFRISPGFEDGKQFSGGMAAVKQNGQWGYIDRSGNWIINPTFDDAGDFREGLAWVEEAQNFGFIDSTGKVVIPIELPGVNEGFKMGIAGFEEPGAGWGFIDKSGNTVIEPSIFTTPPNSPPLIREGLIAAIEIQSKKWGFVDTEGAWVIPALYDKAHPFGNGLAPVLRDGQWGFINQKGKEVIEFGKYSQPDFFKFGLCRVSIQSTRSNYIKTSGELVFRDRRLQSIGVEEAPERGEIEE